ncbi:MAG: gliding motility-associated C-terminal domain-containing protein, partial [Bacteroidetes bacterium]|nr:gliding motility-associated C-terminal domain-containing protein [Bacteroidota bacterium]
GANAVLTATYTITQADVDNGSISNSATANSTEGATDVSDDDNGLTDGNMDQDPTNDPTVVPLTQNPSIEIIKNANLFDLNGDGVGQVNEVITYTFQIINSGNVTLSNINVSDDLVQNLNCGIIPLTLNPGDTFNCTASLTITNVQINSNPLINTASVEADSFTNGLIRDEDSASTQVCTNAAGIIIGRIWEDLNRNNLIDSAENGLPSFITLTPTGSTNVEDVILTPADLNGFYSFENVPSGTYELRVLEAYLGNNFNLFAVNEVFRTITINNCELLEENFNFSAPLLGVVGDFVWFDDNEDGLVGEFFDADNDGQLTLNNANGSISASNFEWIDLNQNGIPDSGEFNRAGLSNVRVNLFDQNNNLVATLTSNLRGEYFFRNLPLNISYTAVIDENDSQNFSSAQAMSLTGLVKQLPPVSQPNQINQFDNVNQNQQANLVPGCGFTTGNILSSVVLSSTQLLDDSLNFGLICSQDASVSLTKALTNNLDEDNSVDISLGDTLEYTITATNQSSIAISNLVLTDDLIQPNSVTCSLVLPGDSCILVGTYRVTPEDVNNGTIVNTATAISDQSSQITTQNTAIVAQNISVSLIKSGVFVDQNDDTYAEEGEIITYTFTISNTGNTSLQNVTLNDPLLGGFMSLSSPINGDLNNDSILDVGESWIVTADYTLTQEDVDNGEVVNQARVEAATLLQGPPVSDSSDDNSPTEDDPTVTPLPTLSSVGLIKVGTFNDEDSDGYAQEGETISYVFTVTNTGTVTLTNITIQDPFATIEGGPLPSLAPGESDFTTFRATYTITQADINAGFFVNQATVFGEDPDLVVVSDFSDDQTVLGDNPTVTPLSQKAAIAIIKTGAFRDNDGNGIAQAGDFIDYTFTVSNLGDAAVENVVVTDPLLGGNISGPASGDTNNDGILDVGEVWVFEATYTLTQDDINETAVVNQATVDGRTLGGIDLRDVSDDDSNEEDEPTVTTFPISNQLFLSKVGIFNDENGNGLADAGETITYLFTVTNTGSLMIFQIFVTDPLVTVTGGPIDLASGESDSTTFSATYTITQDDINLGSVVNQAVVNGRVDDATAVSDLSDDPGDFTESDPNNDGNPDDPTVVSLPQAPGLVLEKSGVFFDENGDGFSQVGETIRYTFTVTNTGNVDLFEVSITDPIVTVSGILTSLPAGATDSSTFTAIYVLTQQDIDNEEVINQATVNAVTINTETVSDISDDPTTSAANDPTVVPLLGDLIIYNGISDNDDGSNDTFTIKGIERFPENLVEIFNRWGVKVFDQNGYGQPGAKKFRGISDGRSTLSKNEKLPEGTYYWILKYKDGNGTNREKAGYLYINR